MGSLSYHPDTQLQIHRQADIAIDWVVEVREPMAHYLLQRQSDSGFMTRLRAVMEALMAELRALR